MTKLYEREKNKNINQLSVLKVFLVTFGLHTRVASHSFR